MRQGQDLIATLCMPVRYFDSIRKMACRGRLLGIRNKKRSFLYFAVCLFVTYNLYHTLTMPVRFLFINRSVNSQCIIPDLDPFDKSIMKYVWHPDPIQCEKTPSLLFVDTDGQIKFNNSAVKLYGSSVFKCVYQILRRYDGDDYHVRFGDEVSFSPPTIIPADFFRVTCRNGAKVVYDNMHESVYSPPVLDKKKIGSETGDQFSVLMFGLDSTSRLSAVRKLPQTYDYVTKQLGGMSFKGYMKVGDNTFPNLIPVLTGKKAWTNELPDIDYKSSTIDSFPFLWRNFSGADYATFFAEDYPDLASFNTEARGFNTPPTDHYMRPFALGLKKVDFVQSVLDSFLLQFEYKNVNLKKHSSLCYGNTPKHKLLIQYYKRFAEMYAVKLKFGVSWLTEICHEYINFLELGDNDFYEFFKYLNDNGYLERSFLIFFSDHGSRIDDIRNTFVGRIEERMPLLTIVVPKVFRSKYPNIVNTMVENTNRLTSNFDLHETLSNILHGKFDTDLTFSSRKQRGISLMKPIPDARSCADAEIPEHYCACYKSNSISTEDRTVLEVAKFAVKELNSLLHKYQDICSSLSLLKIHEAHLISLGLSHAGDELNRWTLYKFFSKPEQEKNKRFLVVFETVPGNAMFEATIDYNLDRPMKVMGDISRTNKYGQQSICVPEKQLRRYCYCKSLLKSP